MIIASHVNGSNKPWLQVEYSVFLVYFGAPNSDIDCFEEARSSSRYQILVLAIF